MLDLMQVTNLTFGHKLYLILLDKGVLALVLASAVYFFNKQLEKQRKEHQKFLQDEKTRDERVLQDQKSRDELLTAIAESRVDAYKKLWAICKQVRFAKDKKITNGDRRNFDSQLDEWYWEKGEAMFLSWSASHLLMEARNRLRSVKHKTDGKQETEDIKKAFSALRTELKYDCGVISSQEKPRKIGDLQKWQLGNDE